MATFKKVWWQLFESDSPAYKFCSKVWPKSFGSLGHIQPNHSKYKYKWENNVGFLPSQLPQMQQIDFRKPAGDFWH